MAPLRLIFHRLLRGNIAVFHSTVKVASISRALKIYGASSTASAASNGEHFNDTPMLTTNTTREINMYLPSFSLSYHSAFPDPLAIPLPRHFVFKDNILSRLPGITPACSAYCGTFIPPTEPESLFSCERYTCMCLCEKAHREHQLYSIRST